MPHIYRNKDKKKVYRFWSSRHMQASLIEKAKKLAGRKKTSPRSTRSSPWRKLGRATAGSAARAAAGSVPVRTSAPSPRTTARIAASIAEGRRGRPRPGVGEVRTTECQVTRAVWACHDARLW